MIEIFGTVLLVLWKVKEREPKIETPIETDLEPNTTENTSLQKNTKQDQKKHSFVQIESMSSESSVSSMDDNEVKQYMNLCTAFPTFHIYILYHSLHI